MSDQEKVIRVSSPAQLVSAVPTLLGFMPADSVVIIGLTQPHHRVEVTLRYDLPGVGDTAAYTGTASHALSVLNVNDIGTLCAVIYGTDQAAQSIAAALQSAAGDFDAKVLEILRVENDRYWSYTCINPQCCPPEGTPFMSPVLASREAVAAQVAPVTGKEADAMRRATESVLGWLKAPHHKSAALNYGINTVHELLERYQGGSDPYISNHDVAAVSVGLRNVRVRDDAWSRMDPEHREAHIKLWTEITRRAQPGYVAASASLLAFCAWQSGNGALANVALDRALADDPNYLMAKLLREVIAAGAPPSLARSPMAPEEVAASYEELDEPEDSDDLREQ